MKRSLIFSFLLLTFFTSSAYDKDSVVYYPLPDSVKAVSFLAEVSVGTITTKKEVFAGIKTDVVKLSLESDKKEREIVFEFPSSATVVANGLAVKVEKGELSWSYNWMENEIIDCLLLQPVILQATLLCILVIFFYQKKRNGS